MTTAEINKKLECLRRELRWALHDNDMNEFNIIAHQIDELEQLIR